jgi:CheY-like chemotaxis protein
MATSPRTILLCEDNEDDVMLFRRALSASRLSNTLQVARDGEVAIDYLAGSGAFIDRAEFPLPILVFVDLKMPRLGGFEVVEWMREHRQFDAICIIVLSSSSIEKDVNRAYATGANGYLVKPPRAADLLAALNLVAHHTGVWTGMRMANFGVGH